MGRLVIFMGATGAGKSIQAERLGAEYGWKHLSSGDLLRADSKMSEVLASGHLAPADETNRVVDEAMRATEPNQVVILDGYPRNTEEVEWLDSQLATWDRELTDVVHFVVSREVSRQRLGIRDRADDTPTALAEKWHEYETQTQAVLDIYGQRKLLHHVDGNLSIEDIYAHLKEELGL